MARGMNVVYLVGTLVQAPEMRYTPGGLAILELNLAGNDHVTGEDGAERELAWYHRATVFGAQAELLANQLQEGTPVLVEGRLNYRNWETPEGQKRSALDVNASRVDVLTYGTRTDEPTVIDARGQHRLKNALNQVVIVGNLTRDAELRYTPSGAAVTRFGVAVNERFRSRSGEDQERTHFVDVTVWRELAEATGELKRGDGVFVMGRLVNDSWTDKEGNRRFTTRLEGQRVEFLTRGPGSGGAGTRPERQATGAQARTSTLDIDEEFPPEEDLPF
ncbi:MAG: single-stranded DNA-binding protein [Deinococcales bacterium]|nr:single-stranded DNA-binding protein [Deinococcales bacterium]